MTGVLFCYRFEDPINHTCWKIAICKGAAVAIGVNQILASMWKFKKMLKIVSSLSPLALGLYTVNAIYGDTITMPCPLEVPDGLMFGKWKYVSISFYLLELL